MPWSPESRQAASERMRARTVITDDGCWLYQGAGTRNGYGRVNAGLAHRVSYEIHVGPIPEGLLIDHKCRNRRCINPQHLEPVSASENIRRGIAPDLLRARNAAISACPQGHPYTPNNTRLNKAGARECRSCNAARHRAYRRRRAAMAEVQRAANGAALAAEAGE